MPVFVQLSILAAFTVASSLSFIFFGVYRGHYWLYGHTSYRNVDASLTSADSYVHAVLQNSNVIHDYVNSVLYYVHIHPISYIIYAILSRSVLCFLFYAFFRSLKFLPLTAVLSAILLNWVAYPSLMTTINISGAFSFKITVIFTILITLALTLGEKRLFWISGALCGLAVYMNPLLGVGVFVISLSRHTIETLTKKFNKKEWIKTPPVKYFVSFAIITAPFVYSYITENIVTDGLKLELYQWINFIVQRDRDDIFLTHEFSKLNSASVWLSLFFITRQLCHCHGLAVEKRYEGFFFWYKSLLIVIFVVLLFETITYLGLRAPVITELILAVNFRRSLSIFMPLIICFVFTQAAERDNAFQDRLFATLLLCLFMSGLFIFTVALYILALFTLLRSQKRNFTICGGAILAIPWWASTVEYLISGELQNFSLALLESLAGHKTFIIFCIPFVLVGLCFLLQNSRLPLKSLAAFLIFVSLLIISPHFELRRTINSFEKIDKQEIFSVLKISPNGSLVYDHFIAPVKSGPTHQRGEKSDLSQKTADQFMAYKFVLAIRPHTKKLSTKSAFYTPQDFVDFSQLLKKIRDQNLNRGVLLADPAIKYDYRHDTGLPVFSIENFDRSLSAFSRAYARVYDQKLQRLYGFGLDYFYSSADYRTRLSSQFDEITKKANFHSLKSRGISYVLNRCSSDLNFEFLKEGRWCFYKL